jgi:hypothetical protein
MHPFVKGKPAEKLGRKGSVLSSFLYMIAGLTKVQYLFWLYPQTKKDFS